MPAMQSDRGLTHSMSPYGRHATETVGCVSGARLSQDSIARKHGHRPHRRPATVQVGLAQSRPHVLLQWSRVQPAALWLSARCRVPREPRQAQRQRRAVARAGGAGAPAAPAATRAGQRGTCRSRESTGRRSGWSSAPSRCPPASAPEAQWGMLDGKLLMSFARDTLQAIHRSARQTTQQLHQCHGDESMLPRHDSAHDRAEWHACRTGALPRPRTPRGCPPRASAPA